VATAIVLGFSTFVPLVLERTGVLSSTIDDLADGKVLVHAPIVIPTSMTVAIFAIYLALILTMATFAARYIRAHDRDARQRLHLQAWQLRQLVS
jgi:hypothetical protein